MSLCLQPECLNVNNSEHKFCQKCGKKLLLSERYRAIKKIGEGGFGVTYYALDEHRWDTPCVIKQFIPLQSGSGALNKCIELFKRSSKLLKELGKHPQIPDLFAFFEQENKLYFRLNLVFWATSCFLSGINI